MMRRRIGRAVPAALLLLLAACDSATPPPPPAAVMTAAQPAQVLDGKDLYQHRCGMCHQGIGMAVSLLSRRPGDTSNGLLEQRKDLAAEFVTTVTRTGIGNMPRIPRGEVSDPEMKAIATYLAKGGQ
jgi:mono/diheme cytochrome c family protein